MCGGLDLAKSLDMERLRRRLQLPALRTARVRPLFGRPAEHIDQHISRAREALLSKIDRVRPKRRTRSSSLPGGRPSAGRCPAAAAADEPSASSVDLSRADPAGLQPGLSTASVETSHTFRFMRPESYENILLTERRRCRSEMSLHSGDEVLARLRAMDRAGGFGRPQPELSLPSPARPVEVVRPMRARRTPPPRPPPPRAASVASLHGPLPTLQEEKAASPLGRPARGTDSPPQTSHLSLTKRAVQKRTKSPPYREPVHPTTPPPPPPPLLSPLSPVPKSMSSRPAPDENNSDRRRRSAGAAPNGSPSGQLGGVPARGAPQKPPRSRSPRLASPAPSSSPSTAPSSLQLGGASDFSDGSTPTARRRDGGGALSSPKSSGYGSSGSPGPAGTRAGSAVGTPAANPRRGAAQPPTVPWEAAPAAGPAQSNGGPTASDGGPTAPPRTLRRRKRPRLTAPTQRTSVFREAFQSSIRNPEVQDVDNGFFENFAQLPRRQELLRQSSLDQAEESLRDLVVPLSLTDGAVQLRQDETITPEQAEELYVEALYAIYHPMGCDGPTAEQVSEIEQLLRELFGPSDEQQAACLQKLENLGSPDICLSCTVIAAKGLKAKDVNGLSDPYCMLFINNEERRETHVCQRTLNPVWNETFKLALDNPATDVLRVEVWDFDMDENLAQRIGKISEIKGVKGLTRYMKEVAKGKSNDTLGHVQIPLQELPAMGEERWYKLQGRAREPAARERPGRPEKERGAVQLRLRFHNVRGGQEEESARRHQRLQLAVLGAARRQHAGPPYTWQAGLVSPAAGCLLSQHAAWANLSAADALLAAWCASAELHCAAPLDYKYLFTTLQGVKQCLVDGDVTAGGVTRFLDILQRFTDHCYETIHMHRHLFNPQSTTTYYSIEYLLRCLVILSEFPELIGKVVERKQLVVPLVPNEEKACNPRRHVLTALRHGNEDWYRHVYASTKKESEEQPGQDARCQSLILLINMLYADVKRGLESYNQIFSRILGINYFSVAYLQFAKKLEQEIGPIVAEISRSLPSVEYREGLSENLSSPEGLDMGTSLFELYLAVQLFTSLRDKLPPEDVSVEEPPLQNAYRWFEGAVNRWLDIACYKAMHRIKRAIELDQATQVHTFVNHSSSAVDTVAVFYQIKTFWKQLNWPDAIGSYGFVTKVLDDITRSGSFYVGQMHSHLKARSYFCAARPFTFTQELCLALNNVEFVREQINPLPNELGFEKVFSDMEEQLGSQGSTIQCRMTLQNVIDEAIEDMEHGITDMVDGSVAQMLPQVHAYLNQLVQPHCRLVPADNIISYLDTNLMLLYPRLHPLNLRRVLESIWLQVLKAIADTARHFSKKETEYFSTISSLVNALVEFINGDDKGLAMDAIHTDKYKQFVHWVNIYKCNPERLISMYYARKFELQESSEGSGYGKLATKAYFFENGLRVEVLNARDIKASDPETCDAYVKIQIFPETLAPAMEKVQTKIQKKTTFPLFDEVFEFSVDRDRLVAGDAHLVFTVKDHHTLVESELLGEAVLPLSRLQSVAFSQTRNVEQQLLSLSPVRMRAEQQEVYRALVDKSSWSSVADEFVRKLNKRLRRDNAGAGGAATISRRLFRS